MNSGKTLFAQIMEFLPWKRFHRMNARLHGDYYVRYFSCSKHFRSMAFAQLAYRDSLRDIEICLSAQTAKLHYIGLSRLVKRATLAEANKRRSSCTRSWICAATFRASFTFPPAGWGM